MSLVDFLFPVSCFAPDCIPSDGNRQSQKEAQQFKTPTAGIVHNGSLPLTQSKRMYFALFEARGVIGLGYQQLETSNNQFIAL